MQLIEQPELNENDKMCLSLLIVILTTSDVRLVGILFDELMFASMNNLALYFLKILQIIDCYVKLNKWSIIWDVAIDSIMWWI